MRLLITIPAYNEEANIQQTIDELPRRIKGISRIDVLVVNDGSRDTTAETASRAGATVITHPYNRGVGAAFRSAVRYAVENKYDIILNTDADGQFNPQDIPRLVRPIIDGKADFITASRFRNRYSHESLVRHLGNKLFTWLVRILTKKPFTDTQCGFRAYSRESLLRLNLMGTFTYTQEVFIDLASKNLRMGEVPIKVKRRRSGKSKVTKSVVRYGFLALKIIMRSFRDYKPLTFFGLPGIVIFSLGALLLLGCLIYWLLESLVSPIRTWLFLGSGLFIFGFLIIIVAIITDMLDRHRKLQEEVLYEMKKR